MKSFGESAYRGRQLFSWLHAKRVTDYMAMTDLPATLIMRLSEEYPIEPPEAVETLTSEIDGTQKYLFALADGNVIESVRMQYHHGASVCISTQVGCRMGCAFCASTIGGRVRDLEAAEMLSQVYQIRELTGERVDSVVLMGSGEPLDNYDNTIRFLRLLTDPDGANLSRRAITVSTCGLAPEIRRLADEGLGVTLAVSLHAPNDVKRRGLMPVAKRYPIPELMDACRYYFDRTGRRVTYEYALIAGENDTDDDVKQLARLLAGQNCHVNLIPVNPVTERDFARTEAAAVESFHKKLENCGIHGTIRRELGSDIQGACGQLRNSYLSCGN